MDWIIDNCGLFLKFKLKSILKTNRQIVVASLIYLFIPAFLSHHYIPSVQLPMKPIIQQYFWQMVFLCDKNNKRWDSSEIEWATARLLVKRENFILPILYKTSCGYLADTIIQQKWKKGTIPIVPNQVSQRRYDHSL